MNIVLFSSGGIHYESGGNGAVTCIYIPNISRVQRFADIPHPSVGTVKERYSSDGDTAPLWRQVGPYVKVYGSMNQSLEERRSSVDAYLPQDFIPEGRSVFYYVFGDKVVHGVRTISDEGQVDWAVSSINTKELGVIGTLEEAVSERMLEGVLEKVIVAVHDDKNIFGKTQKMLEPFEIDVVRFSSLKLNKNVVPLYHHRDHGLFMLTAAMFSFLLLAAAIGYVFVGKMTLEKTKEDIASIQEEIRKIQMNKRLGKIKNPKAILSFMKSSFKQPPSSILHAAAEAGKMFGTLSTIKLADNKLSKGIATVDIALSDGAGDLLIDQERVAKSIFTSRPWIRKIERDDSQSKVNLKIEVQVE